MKTHHVIALGLCLLLPAGPALAGPIDDQAIGQMPVKEITVFKDGHAFVLHEGAMPTDDAGNVVLDYLPVPVIGTFWAYADDQAAKLAGVVAAKRVVSVKRTALTVAEMIEANVGKTALITEHGGEPYAATITALPTRSVEELDASSPPGAPPGLPLKAAVVLLTVEGGTKAVPLERIQEVTFTGEFQPTVTSSEFRNVMTLKLDWGGAAKADAANVGMTYVQRGIRWIPSYRVEIDGAGNATLSLQATLVNELTDLDNVTAHLVIGVPSFAFEDTPDPISMQETVARLSSVMQPNNQTAYAFSNAIMTQQAFVYDPRHRSTDQPAGPTIDLGSGVAAGDKQEDLYVFTVNNITLKKGERMTVPISKVTLPYKDVFVLDLPFGPPPETQMNFNDQQQAELARLFNAPKAKHVLRMVNTADAPLTTAPAMIVREGRVMAQGMIQYTAIGATSDLTMTTAIDVGVSAGDTETDRKANAHKWHGHSYDRIDLTGTVHLTNHRDQTIAVEVRRSVLGFVDSTSHDGEINQLGRHSAGWSQPFWWQWGRWPSWWHYVNSVGEVFWTFDLEADKSIDLGYEWHYFWRW